MREARACGDAGGVGLLDLDHDCDGGETDFAEQDVRVAPRRGDASWFQHRAPHAGRPVTRGVMHVPRGDVLDRRGRWPREGRRR